MVVVPVVALLAAVAGYLGGHFGARAVAARALTDAQGRANRIVDDAKRQAEQARADAETRTREAEARARDAETKIVTTAACTADNATALGITSANVTAAAGRALGLVHLREQCLEARVRRQALQQRIEFHPVHAGIALLERSLEPVEGLVGIAPMRIDQGNLVGGRLGD
jgi:Tfp pilus assembly major pilin PilA